LGKNRERQSAHDWRGAEPEVIRCNTITLKDKDPCSSAFPSSLVVLPFFFVRKRRRRRDVHGIGAPRRRCDSQRGPVFGMQLFLVAQASEPSSQRGGLVGVLARVSRGANRTERGKLRVGPVVSATDTDTALSPPRPPAPNSCGAWPFHPTAPSACAARVRSQYSSAPYFSRNKGSANDSKSSSRSFPPARSVMRCWYTFRASHGKEGPPMVGPDRGMVRTGTSPLQRVHQALKGRR
jgi:hypothetical protein